MIVGAFAVFHKAGSSADNLQHVHQHHQIVQQLIVDHSHELNTFIDNELDKGHGVVTESLVTHLQELNIVQDRADCEQQFQEMFDARWDKKEFKDEVLLQKIKSLNVCIQAKEANNLDNAEYKLQKLFAFLYGMNKEQVNQQEALEDAKQNYSTWHKNDPIFVAAHALCLHDMTDGKITTEYQELVEKALALGLETMANNPNHKMNVHARYFMAYMCLDGDLGKESKFSKASVDWLQQAAEQGHVEAQANVGFCYDAGEGVDEDKAQGVEWLRKAAAQGVASAQLSLSNCYAEGAGGLDQDKCEAVDWMRKAAEQGYPAGIFLLGYT